MRNPCKSMSAILSKSSGSTFQVKVSNPNIEARSTKQIQNPNSQMFKTKLVKKTLSCFEHSDFENLNLFRNWGPARRAGSP
jgi:hypothetical protein